MRLEGGAKNDFRLRKSLWCLNEPLDLRKDESGGVFARWLVRLGSARAPYSAFGTITRSSRIGWKLSKFPTTRTLKRNSGTLSGCTWIRPKKLYCSAATRKVSARHWSARNEDFLSKRVIAALRLMITSAMAPSLSSQL